MRSREQSDHGRIGRADVAVGIGVGGLGALQLIVGDGGAPPVAVAAVAMTAAALVARRVAPFTVAAACLTAFVAILATIDEPGLTQAGPMVALYTVGRRAKLRVATLVAGVCSVVAAVLILLDPDGSIGALTGALLAVISIAVGQAVSQRSALITALEERLDAVDRAQELEIQRRVLADRLRLAHEVHDVIAHTIAVVNVQASVALRHAEGNPPAVTAIGSIRTASAEALDELRALLGVLRDGDEPVPIASAESIGALVRSFEQTGLEVRASIDTERLVGIPPVVLMAAHRVVQEGITNVMRHSTARHAHVAIRVAEDGLTVRVHDPGPARPNPAATSGFGLAGVRERVAMLGGTVSDGPEPGSGFTVLATIPIARPT